MVYDQNVSFRQGILIYLYSTVQAGNKAATCLIDPPAHMYLLFINSDLRQCTVQRI
jgi:hypothetical protein